MSRKHEAVDYVLERMEGCRVRESEAEVMLGD
jgi:hypothetical protein